MSLDLEQTSPPAAPGVRRPPVSDRALADAAAPPRRTLSRPLLGTIGGGIVLALVLVALIIGNLTRAPGPATDAGLVAPARADRNY